MKPMRLTAAHDIPAGADWVFELKYDGFRAILVWEEGEIHLESRAGKRLNEQFPEVVDQCEQLKDQFAPFLPLTLDGELVFLLSEQQSDFAKVQQRGRLKNKEAIQRQAERFPCHFIAFDLLRCRGKSLVDLPLIERKERLQQVFQEIKASSSVQLEHPSLLSGHSYRSKPRIHERADDDIFSGRTRGEKGRVNGRTILAQKEWLKIKTGGMFSVIVTRFDKENGYFQGSIYQNSALIEVVQFKHGFSKEEEQTLRTLFQTKGQLTGASSHEILLLSLPALLVYPLMDQP